MNKGTGNLEQIVERCQNGDKQAMNELFRAIRSDVHHIILRTVGADSEIDDIIQNAMLEIFRSLKNFQGKSQFSTWLYRVVVNVAYQHIRKRKKYLPPVDISSFSNELVNSEETPEATLRMTERAQQIHEIIQQLSIKKRMVFMLHEVDGLSTKEIAETLGCSKFTVKSRLFYARKDFNRLLRQQAVLISMETSEDDMEGQR